MTNESRYTLIVAPHQQSIEDLREAMIHRYRHYGIHSRLIVRHTIEGAYQILEHEQIDYFIVFDDVLGARQLACQPIPTVLITSGMSNQDMDAWNKSKDHLKVAQEVELKGEDIVDLLMVDGVSTGRMPVDKQLATMVNQYISRSSLDTKSDYDWMSRYLEDSDRKKLKDLLPTAIKSQLSKSVVRTFETNERGLYTIWDQPIFASDLAYILAKATKKRVLLIDANRLEPSLDLHLGVDAHAGQLKLNFGQPYASGLKLAFEAMGKRMMNRALLERVSNRVGRETLWVLTGAEAIHDFEYYDRERFERLLQLSRMSFDFVFVATSGFMYDLFTCVAMYEADRCLVPFEGKLDRVRALNRTLMFLEEKQKISYNKHVFCAYNYDRKVDLSMDVLNDVFNGQVGTQIPYNIKREIYRSKKRRHMGLLKEKDVKGYVKVLMELGIPGHKRLGKLYRKGFGYELGD